MAKININENGTHAKTQKDRILDYLMEGHSLTPLEALNLFGCFRLGARIADIKGEGYLIRKEMVRDAATGKRYASYSMV